MMATPELITTVAMQRNQKFPLAPRAAAPTASSERPISSAGTRPNRAMINDPGTAAMASSIGGKLESQPMSVSDKCRLVCKSGTIGGTASTGSRKQSPHSHKRAKKEYGCLPDWRVIAKGMTSSKWRQGTTRSSRFYWLDLAEAAIPHSAFAILPMDENHACNQECRAEETQWVHRMLGNAK